eukprot:g21111.t1
MEWLKSIYGLRCAASQMTDSNTGAPVLEHARSFSDRKPGGALTTLTANPTESKDDRRGCAPVLSSRPQPKKEVQQVIAELEEILRSARPTLSKQQNRLNIMRGNGLKRPETMTFQMNLSKMDMDLDGRPTVKQVLAELESKGGLKALS